MKKRGISALAAMRADLARLWQTSARGSGRVLPLHCDHGQGGRDVRVSTGS